ncbi:peptidoglycan DD-metalloendopeptidase family protein [Mycetocola sp. JXN-3]|uniref:peptidoglycan DD-metalloendopeptidase family protein n=1 Tax=Mycetocola sp. JXN-3 TaxID=2116510 RepID=UPI00165D05D1|nr:peptidoglycan DD-metalloendopeptidase family protein [Mycetocola sp. JXN-3]
MPLPFPLNNVGARFGKRNFAADPYHKGIDFPMPAGTPVPAAAAGTVTGTGYLASINQWVEIDHGNSLVTRYHMLGSVTVARGARVSAGETIGRVGPKHGVSTGEHLHFELRDKTRNDAIYGTAIDPIANITRLDGAPVTAPSGGAPNVRAIQLALAGRDYAVVVDGKDGPQTRGFVTQYQRALGLTPDGVAGPIQTWPKLRIVEDGIRGPQIIRTVQAALGIRPDLRDGIEGPVTKRLALAKYGITLSQATPAQIIDLQRRANAGTL